MLAPAIVFIALHYVCEFIMIAATFVQQRPAIAKAATAAVLIVLYLKVYLRQRQSAWQRHALQGGFTKLYSSLI